MRLTARRIVLGVLAMAACLAVLLGINLVQPSAHGTLPAKAPAAKANAADDPATWTTRQIAARLVLAGVSANSTSQARSWARSGVAGVVLFGTPPRNLRNALASLRAAAPNKRLIVASDEEGGAVQRLSRLIGKFPSAATIGRTRTPVQTRALARSLGLRLKRLGVNSDLAPVADLLYGGTFTAKDGRAFKSNARANAKYVVAFAAGLKSVGVSATVKHWPGGGAVADTHVGGGRTPSWRSLQTRDLVPFRAAFAAGVPSVMVSHARIPGLTGSFPASQSGPAYRALRRQAGAKTVIITDSLAMSAVTRSLRQSQLDAVVRAIRSGADVALVQGINPNLAVNRLVRAIQTGVIKRSAAVASAQRVLNWQKTYR